MPHYATPCHGHLISYHVALTFTLCPIVSCGAIIINNGHTITIINITSCINITIDINDIQCPGKALRPARVPALAALPDDAVLAAAGGAARRQSTITPLGRF